MKSSYYDVICTCYCYRYKIEVIDIYIDIFQIMMAPPLVPHLPPPFSHKSPFHPATKYRSKVLFSYSFLASLDIVDMIAIYEDYHDFTTKHAKLGLMTRLVEAYHVKPPKSKDHDADGEAALHELMLRLVYELFSGYISINDIKYRTWDISVHRDRRHGERIRRLLMRIEKSGRAMRTLRSIMWL
jgi:hypothetical protein